MKSVLVYAGAVFVLCASVRVAAQLVDKNKAPNTSNEGISRPLIGGPHRARSARADRERRNTSLNVIHWIHSVGFDAAVSCFSASSRGSRGRARCPATDSAISTRIGDRCRRRR